MITNPVKPRGRQVHETAYGGPGEHLGDHGRRPVHETSYGGLGKQLGEQVQQGLVSDEIWVVLGHDSSPSRTS